MTNHGFHALCFLLAIGLFTPVVQAEDQRFALELQYGALDGPGEGLDGVRDRRVRDIESAETRGLRLSWSFTANWQVNAAFARTRARYANTESVICGLTGGFVNSLFEPICISLDPRMPGSMHDRIEDTRLTVSRTWAIGEVVRVVTEGGLHHVNWRAPDDLEARLLATCQAVNDLRDYPRFARDVPGCRPVAVGSSETAPYLAVEVRLRAMDGWAASAGVHHQGQRHRIYRSDVVDRSRSANCPNPLAPICRPPERGTDRYAASIPRSSWTWYSVRLGKRLTETVDVYGEWVGGGTRDWDGGQIGVILHF